MMMMLATSFILLQLHSQSAVLEHGGLLMIEQDSQLEICDVICINIVERMEECVALPSPTTIKN